MDREQATNSEAYSRGISVVVPTLNERDTVEELVARLAQSLEDIPYEVIIIDDHSTDGTFNVLQRLAHSYPITARQKSGNPGKAYSLIEGFQLAQYELIAMIDADLQYPPEAIPDMVSMIERGQADVVVANRRPEQTSHLRTFLSRGFRQLFGRLLWKLDVDIQSGLKVFRKEVYERANLSPESPWAFDLEFLVTARNGGYSLAGHDIRFIERQKGTTKVEWPSAAKQLGLAALKLRVQSPDYVPFHHRMRAEEGQGFHFRGKQYVTHTNLMRDDLAVDRTYFHQRVTFLAVLGVVVTSFLINWHATLLAIVSVLTILYFCDLIFNFYLILRSFYRNVEIKITDDELRSKTTWPRYTVFCPLYKETAVLPQFIDAMSRLDYPKDKLEVMLLLEADDHDTIQHVEAMTLPPYFKTVIVPDAMPKTKPKACNYGLLHATGDYAVIYDAEDVPDPLQLKKAVVAFSEVGSNIGCIQAKLNYYNTDQNILTRLFTLEYSLWFNLVLTGLNSINSLIPLGGTSNHFRVQDLRSLQGWDPFNVTEDADLGIRLAKRGMQTVILDSVTLEEANSEFINWMKQRSRWIKGYMQTYLVHMRSPRRSFAGNWRNLVFLQLIVGGKILSVLINPLLWLATISYFAVPGTAEFIDSFYLTPVFYIGAISLVFGNFLYMYYYMVGAAQQQRPELIIHALLVPGYWLMMSFAAVLALRDLLVRPFHWHKTKHGLHLQQSVISEEPQPVIETT